jgi:signal transduction histidine kinase
MSECQMVTLPSVTRHVERESHPFLDWFVPEAVSSPEDARAWRQMATLTFFCAPTLAGFATEYMLLGAVAGALAMYVTAALLIVLMFWGRRSNNNQNFLVAELFVIMLSLCILTIAKGRFTLSSMMWLGFIPVAAIFTLKSTWMWRMLVAAALLGLLCYLLPLLEITTPSISAEDQARMDFTSWLIYILVISSVAHAFTRNRERMEKDLSDVQRVTEGAKRMQAIGELAGGVAHEFNNLLTVIQGNAEALRKEKAIDDDTRTVMLVENAQRHRGVKLPRNSWSSLVAASKSLKARRILSMPFVRVLDFYRA